MLIQASQRGDRDLHLKPLQLALLIFVASEHFNYVKSLFVLSIDVRFKTLMFLFINILKIEILLSA